MASGKSHQKIALSSLVLLYPAFVFAVGLEESWLLLGGYLYGVYYLGPDLDTKGIQYKNWGPLRFIWWPYQRLGGHRSFASQSHDSLFGTVFRLLYLGALISPLLFIWLSPAEIYQLIARYIEPILLCILGLWASDLVHLATDWVHALKLIKN